MYPLIFASSLSILEVVRISTPSLPELQTLFAERFRGDPVASEISVPGRVNLIGEHIDYHKLPVLPMAIQHQVRLAYRPRPDRTIRAVSANFGEREFDWTPDLQPSAPGDWENYLKAAAQAAGTRWNLKHGIDAAITSDLPPAAGLSSSSAVLTAATLALLEANGITATFEELMDVLPEGEYFVGTRGGAMDHAAVLGARAGTALRVEFAPLSITPVPIPADWAFLVAHSLVTAEKSGEVRAQYNDRRTAGTRALERLGFPSYADALRQHSFNDLKALATEGLADDELRSFLHVTGEASRVEEAEHALRAADASTFGRVLNESHASLRDRLRVSCPALDTLVQIAQQSGAWGARLTGAGFGGCAIVFSARAHRERIRTDLVKNFYSHQPGFNPAMHLLDIEPSAGALYA